MRTLGRRRPTLAGSTPPSSRRADLCRIVVAQTLAACAFFTPAAAMAQGDAPPRPRTVQEAEALANRGYELFQQGDYAEAILLFEQAETLSHSPVILSFIAQAHERLGHLVQALATYRRITAEQLDEDAPSDFLRAQRRARRQAPLLDRRIPRVHISVRGADPAEVEVQLDGRRLEGGLTEHAVPIDPGNRTLILRVPDHPPVVRGFVAEERTVSELEVVFAERVPAPTPVAPVEPVDPTRRWLAPAIAFGVGGAGLVLGATAGVVHLTRAADLKERCPGGVCPLELEPERDTLSTLGIAAGIGLGFAAAGIGTGIAFLLVPEDAPSAVTFTPTPTGWHLRGCF